MLQWRKQVAQDGSGRWGGWVGALALAGTVALAAPGDRAGADPDRRAPRPTTSDSGGRLVEVPAEADGVPSFEVTVTPWESPSGDGAGGVAGGTCLPVVDTHTDFNFESGPLVIQAGFAQQEIAAASFVVPDEAYPLIVRTTEMVFAQNHTSDTTTHWSFMVWDGPPNTGVLKASFSSDDLILPHLTLPAQGGATAANIAVTVDPGDPDQIFITNESGTNIITIGYRIDLHNSQTQNPCVTSPPVDSNAFPTTDASGLAEPTRNWIWAINCGPLGCPAGWSRFSQLGLCQPSGDWIIRVTYEPTNCAPGACCMPDGSCLELVDGGDCQGMGGTFQGPGSICDSPCPEPAGACCLSGPQGSCLSDQTETTCANQGGVWLGAGSTCPGAQCTYDDIDGACCFEPSGCSNLSEADCATAGGVFWAGLDTDCASFECNPIGACCMPDGSCTDSTAQADCETAGGTFQGADTTCGGTVCPQPTGACCLASGDCLLLPQVNCAGIPNASWAGPLTTCADDNGNGSPDACETPTCPADVTGDGLVNVDDLTEIILGWGSCPGCPADITGDGQVNVDDLTEIILGWGEC